MCWFVLPFSFIRDLAIPNEITFSLCFFIIISIDKYSIGLHWGTIALFTRLHSCHQFDYVVHWVYWHCSCVTQGSPGPPSGPWVLFWFHHPASLFFDSKSFTPNIRNTHLNVVMPVLLLLLCNLMSEFNSSLSLLPVCLCKVAGSKQVWTRAASYSVAQNK